MTNRTIETTEIHALLDRESIRDTIYKYCRGADRLDDDLLKSCFHADAIDDHGRYIGDVNGLVEWGNLRHQHVEQSLHVICNINIDFVAEDVAAVESYLTVVQRYLPSGEDSIRHFLGEDVIIGSDERMRLIMYGRYVDQFERRESLWKISRRMLIIEDASASIIPATDTADPLRRAVRGPDDPIFQAISRRGTFFGAR